MQNIKITDESGEFRMEFDVPVKDNNGALIVEHHSVALSLVSVSEMAVGKDMNAEELLVRLAAVVKYYSDNNK